MKKVLVCVRFKNGCDIDFLEDHLLTEISDITYESYNKREKTTCNNGAFYCFNYLDVYVLFDESSSYYLDYMSLYETYSDIRTYEFDEANFENFKDIVDNIKEKIIYNVNKEIIIDNKNREAATETQSDSILKCIKRDLKEYNFKGSIDLQSLIKDVKFNPPATIIFWNDGTKTVVKSSEFDDYDPEKGFMLCVMKYLLKPQLTEDKKLRSYYKTITDYTDKFEEYDDGKGWLDEFIESFLNFTVDEESCDDGESVNEPNLTYEKGIDTELKVDENVDDVKSMIDIIFENVNKELKNLDKKALGSIYGCDVIDAKKFLHSIVNDIRNDKFNFVRFHGERPNDIKVEEVNYNHVYRERFVDNIKYVSVIQCCNLEILEKILSNIYHLTTAEIVLYHTNDYDEFMIVSNNTAIIFLNDELDAACFYNLLVDNVQKHFLPLEDARSFIDYPYFQKYICNIITHIVDIKGEQ